MILCQSICNKNSRVTLPAYHDTVAIVLHTLTRSVGVSYLSRYLRALTLTSDILLKHYDHLLTFIIVTRSHKHPHPTWQITRHTQLATGTNPRLKKQDNGRTASLGNVTYLNCRAVRFKGTGPIPRWPTHKSKSLADAKRMLFFLLRNICDNDYLTLNFNLFPNCIKLNKTVVELI